MMRGICLRYNEDQRNKALNCYINETASEEEKRPIPWTNSSAIAKLREFCAETLDSYGEEPGGGYLLCCQPEQVEELSGQIIMAKDIIARCPSCWKNFRQVFCELACSPYQTQFMTAAKVEKAAPGEEREYMVRELNLYYTPRYATRTYESCKDIVMGVRIENFWLLSFFLN